VKLEALLEYGYVYEYGQYKLPDKEGILIPNSTSETWGDVFIFADIDYISIQIFPHYKNHNCAQIVIPKLTPKLLFLLGGLR
jgi:hypothetical protein